MLINNINWGDDSAEKDFSLLEYFISSAAFQRLRTKTKSLVIGRKGSGKSALLKKLESEFKQESDTYVVRLSPKYNSIKSVLNDQDIASNFGKEIFFQHTWLRQIFLDLLCSIGHAAAGKYSAGSLQFARDIATQQNRTSKDFVENIADILSKMKIKAGSLGDFGLQVEKELREVADLDALEHHTLQLAEEGANFIILIDDLDLGWDNSETANNMLLGLLSATTYLSGRSKRIHPIIFLREDVYTILIRLTQHADKYRNVERIRWNKQQLIEILTARINFNRKIQGFQPEDSAFLQVFPETIGTNNTDNWLVERTLSRPRELIQLARYYTESVDNDMPSDEKLKSAEPNYSNWKLDDLCAEYSNQYPGLISIISYWKTNYFRHKYHLKREDIDNILLNILTNVILNEQWFNVLVNETDIDGLLNVLYEIGFLGDFVLGGQGGSRTYYSFEEQHEPLFEEIQIHPCFRRAVNTVERIRIKSESN